MFDIRATRAWWDFFHRFSYVYQGSLSTFDQIANLGIQLLQCHQCQDDAHQFYNQIGSHKTPFEKIQILHNYVNRKLKKLVFSLEQTKQYISDMTQTSSQISKLTEYYFNLLFLMTNYLNQNHLSYLQQFSSLLSRILLNQSNNRSPAPISNQALSIKANANSKFNREDLRLATYEYYNNFPRSSPTKSYQQVFGSEPGKTKTCKSCQKKHQLYLERHNKIKNQIAPPTNKTLPKPDPNQRIPKSLISSSDNRSNSSPRKTSSSPLNLVSSSHSKTSSSLLNPVSSSPNKTSPNRSPNPIARKTNLNTKPLPPKPNNPVKIRTIGSQSKTKSPIRKAVIKIEKPHPSGSQTATKVIYRRSQVVRYKQNRVKSQKN